MTRRSRRRAGCGGMSQGSKEPLKTDMTAWQSRYPRHTALRPVTLRPRLSVGFALFSSLKPIIGGGGLILSDFVHKCLPNPQAADSVPRGELRRRVRVI